MNFTWKHFGPNAIILEWPAIIDQKTIEEIQRLFRHLSKHTSKGITDIIPAYASLTVMYQPSKLRDIDIIDLIKSPDAVQQIKHSRTMEIPVRYHDSTHKDMFLFASFTGLDINEIIEIHSVPVYDVCFIGFLPGFPYLTGLDKKLHIPRKSVPNLRIPKGSVSIGGSQTGIYPQESPGGWYVIGQTAFELIDFSSPPYCSIQSGDKIRFIPV
ncbi:MAG: 5-oxoprolinase subunit PxpB [Saprospiraceae bacterium]